MTPEQAETIAYACRFSLEQTLNIRHKQELTTGPQPPILVYVYHALAGTPTAAIREAIDVLHDNPQLLAPRPSADPQTPQNPNPTTEETEP